MSNYTYGFQVYGEELLVWDFTDPADAFVKARITLPYPGSALCEHDGYLYVACGESAGMLIILNISDIDAIEVMGYVESTSFIYATSMFVRGIYCYVASMQDPTGTPKGRIIKVDISNKNRPLISKIESSLTQVIFRMINDGEYIFAGGVAADYGLCVYDLDLDLIAHTGTYYLGIDKAGDIFCVGNLDAWTLELGLYVVKMITPELFTTKGHAYIGNIPGLVPVIVGDYCYVIHWGMGLPNNTFHAIDISDVDNPTIVASTNDIDADTSGAPTIVHLGDYLYITGVDVYIVDVSTPASPSLVASYNLGTDSVGQLVVKEYLIEPYDFRELGSGVSTNGDIEGYLTVLNDDRIVGTLDVTGTASEIFQELLAYSSAYTAGVLLWGGIDTALDIELTMSFTNKTILKCMLEIVAVLGGYLSVRPDPNDPHVRYLYHQSLEEDFGQEVRVGKNLKSLKRSIGFGELCTRMAPLGGDGNQLSLALLNETATAVHQSPDDTYGYLKLPGFRCYTGWTALGAALPTNMSVKKNGGADVVWTQGRDPRYIRCAVASYDPTAVYTITYWHAPYLIADTYDSYGQITKDYEVKGVTTVADLLIAAETELAKRQYPQAAYSIEAIDLSEIGRPSEALAIGSKVWVIDNKMNINIPVPVKGIKKSLLNPGDVAYTFENYPLSVADRMAQQQQAIDDLRAEGVNGVSIPQAWNATIGIDSGSGEHPRAFKFRIPSYFIRCASVKLTWIEDDAGRNGGSETIDFDVTVDGNAIGHGTSMTDEDITAYLDLPIIATEHVIEWEYRGASEYGCFLHITVVADLYRRSQPLFE